MAIGTLDQFNFHHTLAETVGVSLVYFTSPACGACRQLRSLFEKQSHEFTGITIFEVDAQREMALTHEFNLFHLPAMFLYLDGEYHAEIHAEARSSAIFAAVEAARNAPSMEAP